MHLGLNFVILLLLPPNNAGRIVYKVQIAPAFLAHVVSLFSRAEDYAWDFIKNHALMDCPLAHQMAFALAIIDSFLKCGLKGWINYPATELLVRQAYALEVAFRNCYKKEDWFKAANAPKSWVSKVDWLGLTASIRAA